jgi:hypothetical protein
MMIAKLRERLRSWLAGRWEASGAIPTELHPAEDAFRTREHAQPPPIPGAELPQLESDVVVMEDEDPDVRAWADAFVAATSGAARKS